MKMMMMMMMMMKEKVVVASKQAVSNLRTCHSLPKLWLGGKTTIVQTE
jgi:hypothetical protein